MSKGGKKRRERETKQETLLTTKKKLTVNRGEMVGEKGEGN